MTLRLGFHYHIPMVRGAAGELRTPGYLGRFLDGLAAHCERLVCFAHSPRPDELALMDYALQSPVISWVDIGLHTSVPARMLHARALTRPLRALRGELDTLLLRGPSPLLPAMASAAGDLPVALLLVGDYLDGVDDRSQPAWRRQMARWWSVWNQRAEQSVARRALTFVNSQALYDRLRPIAPALIQTRTTTLTDDDFFERSDTCQARPIRILYCGRVIRSKGLLVTVEAIARLVAEGEDVVFEIVGNADRNDPIEAEIERLAARRGIAGRVVLHGYAAMPGLFEHYRRADLYVVASIGVEGFPRSIWEAMAHSVPVVATAIGSIPLTLQDGETALIVAPDDAEALASALRRLIRDPALRRRLIRQGAALARPNTLERRSAEMISHIEQWLRIDEKTAAPRPL